MSFIYQLISIVRKVYERTAKELRKTHDKLESYERVTKSLRKVSETIRNSLVTFS